MSLKTVTLVSKMFRDFTPENKNLIAGIDELPFLFNFSRGQRKGTLVFHIKIGTVDVFQTYSPELSTDFQIPEDHLLIDFA
jgi:hypothetical protein